MARAITDDISVKVTPTFEGKQKGGFDGEYLFSYTVEIHNAGSDSVQLLSRHWYIFDSNAQYSEVKGEGVIGEQPVIHPGNSHSYSSYCKLNTDMGLMWGTYLMKRMEDGKLFEVKIPEFQLVVPYRQN